MTVMVNNVDHSYKSNRKEIQEDDIAMVDCTVEGIKGKLLIDSCSNLNIITRKYLDKIPRNFEPIGISCGRIRLATNNDEYSESVIIRVPIRINNFTMTVNCRIVEKEDPFYDVLINLKTQAVHRLFIHPVLNSLCRFSTEGFIEKIAQLNNDFEDESKLLCSVTKIDDKEEVNIKAKLKTIED